MADYAVTRDWPDTITFDRLHALARRGYRAGLGIERDDSGFSKIELSHPRSSGPHVPPNITLWSNGIVATGELLWPSRHVPREDGSVPIWQKLIDVTEDDVFKSFIESVPTPTLVDLYLIPGAQVAKIFLARLTFAASLCFCIAVALLLIEHALAT